MMTITDAHSIALTHGATTEQLEEARDRLITAAINERNLSYLELIDRRLSRIYAEERDARQPFDPPYTAKDLPELDRRHSFVGLGVAWLQSDRRAEIAQTRETATTPTMPNEGNGDQASP